MFFLIFLLKDNCFKEFCSFLSNLDMNQPQVYTYPLPFDPPSCLPPHSTPLSWYRAPAWVSWARQQIPVGYLFTHGNVSFRVTLSIHLTLSSPLSMSISLFSISVSPLLPMHIFVHWILFNCWVNGSQSTVILGPLPQGIFGNIFGCHSYRVSTGI